MAISSSARKLRAILTASERKGALVLMGLMVLGAALETIGLSLVVPAIALFMEPDLGARYPQLRGVLQFLGNPTQTELVVGGMAVLVAVYLVKTLFLVFLVWRQ